jgi:hypothetical protein
VLLLALFFLASFSILHFLCYIFSILKLHLFI